MRVSWSRSIADVDDGNWVSTVTPRTAKLVVTSNFGLVPFDAMMTTSDHQMACFSCAVLVDYITAESSSPYDVNFGGICHAATLRSDFQTQS
tara:strand:+ start:28084 stop:28359 length:276 start_codon:yes stop_codon:yes gene_type:complete